MDDSIVTQIADYLSEKYDKRTFGVCWEPRVLYLLKPIELNGKEFSCGFLQEHNNKYHESFFAIKEDAKEHLGFSFSKDELFDAIDRVADCNNCFGSPFKLGFIAGRAEAARQFFSYGATK